MAKEKVKKKITTKTIKKQYALVVSSYEFKMITVFNDYTIAVGATQHFNKHSFLPLGDMNDVR